MTLKAYKGLPLRACKDCKRNTHLTMDGPTGGAFRILCTNCGKSGPPGRVHATNTGARTSAVIAWNKEAVE